MARSDDSTMLIPHAARGASAAAALVGQVLAVARRMLGDVIKIEVEVKGVT